MCLAVPARIDKLVINTAGIGIIEGDIISDYGARPGDKIMVSGTMGDHGMGLVALRFGFKSNMKSDEAQLWGMMKPLFEIGGITSAKDATRGGFSPNINELARKSCTRLSENCIQGYAERYTHSDQMTTVPITIRLSKRIHMAEVIIMGFSLCITP